MPITDSDWGDGVSHEFTLEKRSEPPIVGVGQDDSISLVVSAVRTSDWFKAESNNWTGRTASKIDLCKKCTLEMVGEIVKEKEE
jgi:hypothetical protein